MVQDIRRRLTALAARDPGAFTAVLMQGSGSFGVEATLGTAVPRNGKLLVLANGAYGLRMAGLWRPWAETAACCALTRPLRRM